MSVYQKIIDLLDRNKIQYKTYEHEPVRTSEEAAKVRGTDISLGAKALICYGDGKPLLLVLGGDKRADLKKVKQQLGIRDLRMATAEEVLDLTTVEVGGVPPFGNVLGLPTYLDRAFQSNTLMEFNAGDRTKSVEMTVKDYIAIVHPIGIDVSLTS